MKFPDKLCFDIQKGRECSKGKDCEYSHDRHHFDENGKPKVQKVKQEKSSSAQAGTAEQPPSVHSSAAAGLTHTAFGSHSPGVQVEVASTRGGHRQRRKPPLVWRLPDAIKKLLEKFDAERQEEDRTWHDRMQDKELFAMKRARAMGWKRTDGSDLKLDRLSELPADRWVPNCPNDLGGYQYITEITIIDRSVQTMLDTGAACNTIPEELVTAMLRRCAKLGIPQREPGVSGAGPGQVEGSRVR